MGTRVSIVAIAVCACVFELPVEAASTPKAPPGHPLKEFFQAGTKDTEPPSSAVPGQVLVKFRKDSVTLRRLSGNFPSKTKSTRNDKLDQLTDGKLEPVFKRAKISANTKSPKGKTDPLQPYVEKEGLFRWYRVDLKDGLEASKGAKALEELSDVEAAEPVYEWRLAAEIDPPIEGIPDGTTDPLYVDQWFHAASKVPNAWDYLRVNGVYPGGSHDVVVAVVDSGVDYNHEDLKANIWTNSGEIPANGVDDDENGFVDDVHGCNVVSDPRSHSGDPQDYLGHGTHVAGIVGAQGFNNLGGVGVAFNCQIMPVRAAQYSGILTTTDIAEGIYYAAEHGADVINMSFGGYGRSQLVVDALAVAFNQAVLVAAAGNDQLPTESESFCNNPAWPSYPASIPWVIGVMSHDPAYWPSWFTNYDPCPQSKYEYEVLAPGESILSTIPGNRYASWSGTSMATPIVSGIAALMRSFFWQREIYSSRFLAGSIIGGGGPVDAYWALTEPPTPGVTMLERWIFDSVQIDPGNNADGGLDSGEKIHMAVEVINRSGQADEVTATLRAHAQGAVEDDPWVTIDTPTVDYQSLGPFQTADNGFMYNEEGVITGVERPFVFTIDPQCPNDHVIPFELTLTFRNGWDPEDTTVYERVSRFTAIVQRGKKIPTVVAEDMELTSDEYWIVPGPVLVEEQATLTIQPGTTVQFGFVSDDPYNPGPQSGYIVVRGKLMVEGTYDNPVSFFPSYLVNGQETDIRVEDQGRCEMRYAEVQNPELKGIRHIDHCYLSWDRYSSTVQAEYITNTIFHKLRGASHIDCPRVETCLFSAGRMAPRPYARLLNSTLLQDNENDEPLTVTPPIAFTTGLTNYEERPGYFFFPEFYEGSTYVLLPMAFVSLQMAERIANFFGGHVTSVRDAGEADFLHSYLDRAPGFFQYDDLYSVGLSDDNNYGEYTWTDGSELTFTDWDDGFPVELSPGSRHIVQVYWRSRLGRSRHWRWQNVKIGHRFHVPNDPQNLILRLPGEWTVEELNAPMEAGEVLEYVVENYVPDVRFNAFLNKYWDPNIDHWMRIQAPGHPDRYAPLYENYWGTTSTTLIDHAIRDYHDTFEHARIPYGDPPEHGYETTYPFVETVHINGMSAVTVPELGAGPTTFTLHFNRPMDTSVHPFVTFGPTTPYTDFQVEPVGDGWTDPQTWEGTFYIVAVTGDGYHLMRISGAVAADDPWLVSGYGCAASLRGCGGRAGGLFSHPAPRSGRGGNACDRLGLDVRGGSERFLRRCSCIGHCFS